MEKITIKNICNAMVSIHVPEANFSREIPSGREIPIPHDTYEALTFDQGFMNLVNMHYIQVLGVPAEEAIVPPEEVITTKDEINKMLDDLDITALLLSQNLYLLPLLQKRKQSLTQLQKRKLHILASLR